MSRKKKSRKPGANPEPVIVTRNRTESDVEGRLRKRLKKRKGQKSGSRHSEGSKTKQAGSAAKLDPRLGSKKKIPLIVDDKKKPIEEALEALKKSYESKNLDSIKTWTFIIFN